jgi:hypothetical protein
MRRSRILSPARQVQSAMPTGRMCMRLETWGTAGEPWWLACSDTKPEGSPFAHRDASTPGGWGCRRSARLRSMAPSRTRRTPLRRRLTRPLQPLASPAGAASAAGAVAPGSGTGQWQAWRC